VSRTSRSRPGSGRSALEQRGIQIALNAAGRLTDEQQFRDIIVKTGADGQVVQLGDIARVELGAQAYGVRSLLDNKPSLAIRCSSPRANALELSTSVRKTMEELKKNFRRAWTTAFFMTHAVRAPVDRCGRAHAARSRGSCRAGGHPLSADLARLTHSPDRGSGVRDRQLRGVAGVRFSINTLSLFGLVLAIGIVVDDAIVVVENVERHIAEASRHVKATKVAMSEVSRPIIAITLVLVAVFGPVAFVSGLTGEFYRSSRSPSPSPR